MYFSGLVIRFENGAKVRRQSWNKGYYLWSGCIVNHTVTVQDLLADDWEEFLEIGKCPFCHKTDGNLRPNLVNTNPRKSPNLESLHQVVCPSCGAAGPADPDPGVAIRNWNDVSNLQGSENISGLCSSLTE